MGWDAMQCDAMRWDGTGPQPGTSSRSEVHLLDAAGNVKSSERGAGSGAGAPPKATLSPTGGAEQVATSPAGASQPHHFGNARVWVFGL